MVGRKIGEIITIETLQCPAALDWTLEDSTKPQIFPPNRCVSIIRLFYAANIPQSAQLHVGIKDFVPSKLSGDSFFRRPEFEAFSSVVQRASDWLADNPEADFKNAQCLEMRMKSISSVDSSSLSHVADRGNYLRIFRVAYVCDKAYAKALSEDEQADSIELKSPPADPPAAPIYLSSVIFTPADKDACVQDIRLQIEKYIAKLTRETNDEIACGRRPRVLSAETVEIFTKNFTDDEIRAETENTFKFNRIGVRNSFLFIALRVYFDVGYFRKEERSKSVVMNTRGRTSALGCVVS